MANPKKPRAVSAPNRDELLSLPLWPRVAFCARVARRFLPLLVYWETKAQPGYEYLLSSPSRIRGIRSCVFQTEQAAAHAAVQSEEALYKARDITGIAESQAEFAAELAKRKKLSPQFAAALAASTAHEASTGAFISSKPEWNFEWGTVVYNVMEIGKIMKMSAAVNAAVRADFDRLESLIEEHLWGHNTPVPRRVFGPLWPEGTPQGWPEDA
jgi:hypothetical protein